MENHRTRGKREDHHFWNRRILVPLVLFVCAAAILLAFAVRKNGETLFHFEKETIRSILLSTSEEGWSAREAESVSRCVDLLNSFQYRSTKTVNPGRDDNGSHYQLSIYGAAGDFQGYCIGSNWSAILAGRTWYYGEEGCLKPLKEILEQAAEDEALPADEPVPVDPPTGSEAPLADVPVPASTPASSGKLCDFDKDDVAYIIFSTDDKRLTWQDEESISLCVDLLNSFRYSGSSSLDPDLPGEEAPFSLSLFCPAGRGHECYSYDIGVDWGSVYVAEFISFTRYSGEENYFEPIKRLAGLG